MIDNFRWAGVPFYIRTGKRMAAKSTKIVVQFKDIPMNLYYNTNHELNPNLLVIHIQPEEGISLHLNAKNRPAYGNHPCAAQFCKQQQKRHQYARSL